ncbi:hypothetical protein KDL45_00770 [bacterium]|nr:hypothetical protein [bacterium]MCB9479108.1 hypothetical protein [Deltaproteobacteria bacterium]
MICSLAGRIRWIAVLAVAVGACVLARPAFLPAAEDDIDGWRTWKSIDAAVQLRDLDGPEDIIEKAEIIEDRADEQRRELTRLAEAQEHDQDRLKTLREQRELLQDLSELQFGGDGQTRSRLQNVDERIRRQEARLDRRAKSMLDLESAWQQTTQKAAAYRVKAEQVRAREKAAP